MSLMTGRCPTCGNQGVDSWHVSRCAYLADLRARVEQHAATYNVPAVAARDLFAHMRQISDDGEQAMRRVLTVLDLGWRPCPVSDVPRCGAQATEQDPAGWQYCDPTTCDRTCP